jgi:hypothetical protein
VDVAVNFAAFIGYCRYLEEASEALKPTVEIQHIQRVLNELNELLAADLLQNQLGAPQGSTIDCASSGRGLFLNRLRTRRRLWNDAGLLSNVPIGERGRNARTG